MFYLFIIICYNLQYNEICWGEEMRNMEDNRNIFSKCQTKPEQISMEDIISRDNLILYVEEMFNAKQRCIIVEGKQGTGKSHFVYEFAAKNYEKCISIFIRNIDKWGYDIEILKRDIFSQIYYFTEENNEEEPEYSDGLYSQLLYKLNRKLNKLNGNIYFLIDGFDKIPDKEILTRHKVIELLPLSLPKVRFIFTSDIDNVEIDKYVEKIGSKRVTISGFSKDETKKFLEDLNLTDDEIKYIFELSRGNPEKLEIIKNSIKKYGDMDKFINTKDFSEILEKEWKNIKDDLLYKKVLAILTHETNLCTVEQIAQILNVTYNIIEGAIDFIEFIKINQETNRIEFVNESYKNFCKQKLVDMDDSINNIIADYLFENQTSDNSIKYLPNYLEKSKRYKALIEYLAPYNFIKLLAKSQSLYNIEDKVDIGIRVANKIGSQNEIISLSLYKSIFLEFEKIDILQSELRACLALDDLGGAINLAQSAITKDDKLQLLSIIGKHQKEKNNFIDDSILEQIRILFTEINYEMKPEKSLEIASDLIYCCPELAIDLIERKNNDSKLTEENNLDFIFASLSLRALGNDTKNEDNDIYQQVNSRIKNEDLRSVPKKIALLVGNYTANQVLQEVIKFKTTTEKLFFLTRWTEANKEREDTYDVILEALQITIATTTYAPNAKIYRELASPLPYINDKAKLDKLIFMFENQQGTIEKMGPTEEYVCLQITLIKAIFKNDKERAVYKIIEIKDYINQIEDLSLKTLCLAYLLDDMQDMKNCEEIEDLCLYTDTAYEFTELFDELLLTSADHYETCINIITTLANNTTDMAYDLIKRINTEERRDRALYKVLSSIIYKKVNELDVGEFCIKLDEIINPQLKNSIIIKLLDRLESDEEFIEQSIGISLRLTSIINNVNDLEDKCYIFCAWYQILNKKHENQDKCNKILETIKNSWEKIDVIWSRVNIGYIIVSRISRVNPEFGKELFKKIKEIKKEHKYVSKETSILLIRVIQLAIRAFSGLLRKKINSKDDFKKISDAIRLIPSDGERAFIWSDMALRCHKEHELNLFNDIMSNHVRPLIMSIDEEDKQYSEDLIIRLSPSLYFHNRVRALEEIKKLIEIKQNEAYYRIAEFIFTKQTPSDPYENHGKCEFNLTYDEISDLIAILRVTTHEFAIYYIISGICTSIYRNKTRVTQNQKEEVKNQLEQIVDSKLPNLKNIKHDGYKIICKAQISRIDRKSNSIISLVEETRKINNLSDRAYVLTILATLSKTKETTIQTELLEEAKKLIDQLPSFYDKIDLYESLANNAWMINSSISRSCMTAAMSIAVSKGKKCEKAQRQLIDLAYRLDPDLASSLVSLADDDCVRKEVRENIRKEVSVNDTKKAMSCKFDNDCEKDDEAYSKAAWKLLAGLNANRQTTVSFEESLKYMKKVSEVPLQKSYPILSWIIQNNILKYSNSEKAEVYIKGYFEKLILGIDLIVQLSDKAIGNVERDRIISLDNEEGNSIIINPGEREYAIDYIKKWFEENIEDTLIIADPFFGFEELELVKLVSEVKSEIDIKVLTSIKHQSQNIPRDISIDEYYQKYWKANISDTDPPYCEIVLVGGKVTNEPPIHDRWIIGENSGLRLGTSYNSLGITKVSEISKITKEETNQRRDIILNYLNRHTKSFNNEKLNYKLFSL